MPIFVDGGAVLVEDGLRFDLANVMNAMMCLIDLCAKAFEEPPLVRTIHPAYGARIRLDERGKEKLRKTWIAISRLYEAICEPFVVVFPGFCLKLYPFGMAWCEYYASRKELLAPGGAPFSEFDPTPMIVLYGAERADNLFDLASLGLVQAMQRIVTGPLVELGMTFVKSEPFHVSTDMTALGQFARIVFPHAVFGAGHGPIRIRCVRKEEPRLP